METWVFLAHLWASSVGALLRYDNLSKSDEEFPVNGPQSRLLFGRGRWSLGYLAAVGRIRRSVLRGEESATLRDERIRLS